MSATKPDHLLEHPEPTEEQKAAFYTRSGSDPVADALNHAASAIDALRFVRGHELSPYTVESLGDASMRIRTVWWLVCMGFLAPANGAVAHPLPPEEEHPYWTVDHSDECFGHQMDLAQDGAALTCICGAWAPEADS